MASTGSRRTRRDRKFHRSVGARIAELRTEAGLSQIALAEATGIKLVRISRLEGGLVRLLAEEVPRLAGALGVGDARLLTVVGVS